MVICHYIKEIFNVMCSGWVLQLQLSGQKTRDNQNKISIERPNVFKIQNCCGEAFGYACQNKTGLQPVTRPVEQVHYFGGFGKGCKAPLVPRLCRQTSIQGQHWRQIHKIVHDIST